MHLAHPVWLFLLLLLPILGVLAAAIGFRPNSRWAIFAAPRLRGALIRQGSIWPRWLALIFLLAGCAALIATLSRPQGDAGTKTEKTKGRNILIALDLSRSMRVDDVKPDRLNQAKIVVYELLEKLPNDRIGLLGFAGNPYLYAPLTIDHAAVRETVGQIDETWAPVGGSDLSAALKLAIETLKKTGQKNNALVILSDGEENEGENDLDTMIKEAESSGVYIYAIGVGTPEGGYVPGPEGEGQFIDRSGNPVLSRLQPGIMQRLAEETGGRYVPANAGTNILAMVDAATRDLDSFENVGRERKIIVEFYQWLLLPAILFLMVSILSGTRWRRFRTTAATALLAAGFIFMPQSASANLATEAKQALESKKFEEARKHYHQLAQETKVPGDAERYRIGEGTAAYRAGDFREARKAFSGALLSKEKPVAGSAHFGMGNTLFQLGWQGLTDQSYPTEPGDVPDLERFETLVKERLALMKQSEEESIGRSEEYIRMDSLILNWADAVRHYDSTLERDPGNSGAKQNKETTMIYLRKLQELLELEKKETEKSMPQQGQ